MVIQCTLCQTWNYGKGPWCGGCHAAITPPRRKQPAAYGPGGKTMAAGGWATAGKAKGKGKSKGWWANDERAGPKGGGGKGTPPPLPHELEAAIAGIVAAAPSEAAAHHIFEPQPELEDKGAVASYKQRNNARLSALRHKMHGAKKLGHDTSDDAVEVSVLKRMLASLVPVHTQVANAQRAHDQACAQRQQVEVQEEALRRKKADLDWRIDCAKRAIAELSDPASWWTQECEQMQQDEEGWAGEADEGDQAERHQISSEGENGGGMPAWSVCMHTEVAVPKSTGSLPKKPAAKAPLPPPPPPAGGHMQTAATTQASKASPQVTAEEVNKMLQQAQEAANEKMLQAVAAAVQQAMATAMASAAAVQQVAPGNIMGGPALPALPTPAYEVPSRSPPEHHPGHSRPPGVPAAPTPMRTGTRYGASGGHFMQRSANATMPMITTVQTRTRRPCRTQGIFLASGRRRSQRQEAAQPPGQNEDAVTKQFVIPINADEGPPPTNGKLL